MSKSNEYRVEVKYLDNWRWESTAYDLTKAVMTAEGLLSDCEYLEAVRVIGPDGIEWGEDRD